LKLSSKFKDSSNFVLIGKIVAVHGIKGAVKVVSYAETLTPFERDKILWVPTVNGSFEQLKVSCCKPYKNSIRLGIYNVINRNQAEAMVGLDLFINKDQLPQLEEGTYYWFDLIGLRVKTTTNEFIGYIDAIIPTGGNDVYVIKPSDTSCENERLIPAVADFIQCIDLEQRTMIVHLPEGL
jgi:16S rRNA processing protein RimM